MLLMSDKANNGQKFARDYRANTRALRRLRARAKLTLKQLADKSGINYTTINRIEQGHNRSPHWPTLEDLASALGVEVEEIVIFDDEAEAQLPGGARTEEHLDAVLDHEAEVRERQKAGETEREGNGPGGSRT